MSPDGFKTQVLLLHSDQGTLDKLGSEFDLRYTVHFATSGSEALEALADAPIDIFVSADDLPGMSGREALREAKTRSPQTLGILLTDSMADDEAATVSEDNFQIMRGHVTGEALFKLVENASRRLRLPVLSKSANDAMAHAGFEPEHIVMATAEDGSSIISQSSVRLRALNPTLSAAAAAVDVLVLTKDTEFLDTIRESSHGMHAIYSATTLPEANDIMREHEVGVAIVDAGIVREKIEHLTKYLRRESPRLVSVIAGRRDDGEMLIDHVNRGNVYRFLLKPVSCGRARLAIAASVKHHLEAPDNAFAKNDDATEPPPAATESNNEVAGEFGEEQHQPEAPGNSRAADSLSKIGAYRMAALAAAGAKSARPTWAFGKIPAGAIGGAAAVLAIVGAGVFFLGGQPEKNRAPQAVAETTVVAPVTTETKVVAPVTAETKVVAPVTAETEAVSSPPAVEQLITVAETALLDGRLRDAEDALQRVSNLDAANARLPFLTAQLEQARLRMRLNEARVAIREGRFDEASDALLAAQSFTSVSGSTEFETLTAELNNARSEQETDALLALATARLEAGALLSPPKDSARYFYERVLSNDPENPAAQQGLMIIAARESATGALAATNRAKANASTPAQPTDDLVAATPPGTDANTTSRPEVPLAAVAQDAVPADAAPTDDVSVDDVSVDDVSVDAVPADDVPADAAPTDDVSVDDVPADDVPADDVPADDVPANVPPDEIQPTVMQTAPEIIAAATPELVPSPVAEDRPTLKAAPAAVSSLVRTKYVAPKYPRNALRRNLSGWVDVEFTVSVYGAVKDAKARASEPGVVFEDAAIRAVEQWQFEPVMSDGVYVERRTAVRIMFSLD